MEVLTATVIAQMTVDIKAGTFKILTQFSESGFLTVSFGALKGRHDAGAHISSHPSDFSDHGKNGIL